jgi:hypothetical protein
MIIEGAEKKDALARQNPGTYTKKESILFTNYAIVGLVDK